MGRHVLSKKYAFPVTEFKGIADGLFEKGILTKDESELMRRMAGYRNRMTHFYHEITPEELLDICNRHLGDITLLQKKSPRTLKISVEIIQFPFPFSLPE